MASSTLTLGLLADTHIPYRMKAWPAAALEALAGVDMILHAGDVDSPLALAPLQAIAPVYAVRGNVHFLEFSDGGAALPAAVELRLSGRRVVLTHGHQLGWFGLLLKSWDVFKRLLGLVDNGYFNQHAARRLMRAYPHADVIVFGHTHRTYAAWAGVTLLVNPGAVCPTPGEQPSLARLTLGEDRPRVEFVTI